jgi:predicted nucleic acid-binding protein
VIVVDANVLVYLFVPGRHTAAAERAMRRDPRWVAPALWRSEFRNALLGVVRQGVLAPDDAVQMLREAEGCMRGGEYAVVSEHVFHLAVRSGCSAYDCEYVAVAQDLGVALVTSDRQLIAAFPGTATALASFARRAF